MDASLSADQLQRYARQLVLEEVGADGQGRLREASILVVGAGGLGAPAIMYVAGAGIGRLGIVDDDVVERSNLHRQVIHADADLGRPKVDSAAQWVRAHNPDVTVESHETTVTIENVRALLGDYDIVVDATDRFPTRYLLNDACALTDTPYVFGAVYRFEGQVASFDAGSGGPCYRCLFPSAPPPDDVQDCATAGVLGPVPGMIGAFQAAEAITLASGARAGSRDRMLVVNALEFSADSVQIASNPACPVCGEGETITTLEADTYDGRCAIDRVS